MSNGPGNLTNTADIGGAFCHTDGTACVEEVKRMSGFQNHFIGRKSKVQVHQALGFTLKVVELLEKFFRVACLKVVVALLDFVLMEDVAVSENVFAGSVLPLGCRQGRKHCRSSEDTLSDVQDRM